MKVDAFKIKEIAKKLGVSERTVEEYLLDRISMVENKEVSDREYATAGPSGVIDRFGRALDKDAG